MRIFFLARLSKYEGAILRWAIFIKGNGQKKHFLFELLKKDLFGLSHVVYRGKTSIPAAGRKFDLCPNWGVFGKHLHNY